MQELHRISQALAESFGQIPEHYWVAGTVLPLNVNSCARATDLSDFAEI